MAVVLGMTGLGDSGVPRGKWRRRQLEGNEAYESGDSGCSNSSAPFMMGSGRGRP